MQMFIDKVCQSHKVKQHIFIIYTPVKIDHRIRYFKASCIVKLQCPKDSVYRNKQYPSRVPTSTRIYIHILI